MPMFPPTENLEELIRAASSDEAICAMECARSEAKKRLEEEKLEARPAHIKAEEDVLSAGYCAYDDDCCCNCFDCEEFEKEVRQIFLKYFGQEGVIRGHP